MAEPAGGAAVEAGDSTPAELRPDAQARRVLARKRGSTHLACHAPARLDRAFLRVYAAAARAKLDGGGASARTGGCFNGARATRPVHCAVCSTAACKCYLRPPVLTETLAP